jgi:hypothetical protein
MKKIWEEAVITYFKILYRKLPGFTEENHENISQDTNSMSRTRLPSEWEYEVLQP